MKEHKKLSLHEEINREAEEIEKKIEEKEDLDDLKVSENMEASLFNKIQEYEFNNRTRIVHRKKKKKYVVLALAAVLVLVFGSMMTSVGSKSYWKVFWNEIVGDENLSYIDVDNMETQEPKDVDQVYVYKEIRNKLGISIVRLGYMPKEMFIRKYEVDNEQKSAIVLYEYEGKIVRYLMYINNTDSSFAQIETDELINEYELETTFNEIVHIKEYKVKNENTNRYVAEFEYQDAQYQLMGIIEKAEFDEIIKNLYFLN